MWHVLMCVYRQFPRDRKSLGFFLLQIDFTLSFLDSYVSAALESGAEPYRPRGFHQSASHNVEGLR